MSWRTLARPVIAKVLEDTRGKSGPEITKALRDAYPWGPRQYHPYKIWCDEVRRQRGLKVVVPPCKKPCQLTNELQQEMFDA